MKDRSQKTEVRSQKTGVRLSEVMSQMTEAKLFLNLSSVLCVLFSVFCLLSSVSADDISARAAIVIDGNSEKILYAKNPNLKLPPASTTKLVTAMVVLDRVKPDTIVTVSRRAAEVSSVSPHLRAGERFTVEELLHLSLMRSVNSAAVALAEAVSGSEDAFVRLMNDKVSQIGVENTRFVNASGLPGEGQYITAYDLAKIMKESLRYPLIREIINLRIKEISSIDGRRIVVKNTNQLLWTDNDVIGGKTGYTRAARHCFVCATKKEQNILIAAVLGETVRDNLWDDITALLSRGYNVVNNRSEPVIYFSNVNQKPVVLASYDVNKSDRKYKKAKVATKVLSGAEKNKKIKTAKKQRYKKDESVNIARKNGAKRTRGIS